VSLPAGARRTTRTVSDRALIGLRAMDYRA
jgi:hypothetical protein